MSPIYDNPVAVLLCSDGEERVLALTSWPPQHELRLSRQQPAQVRRDDGVRHMPNDRVFRLTTLTALDIRWWRIYNEGKSRSPEASAVYFEVALPAAASPQEKV